MANTTIIERNTAIRDKYQQLRMQNVPMKDAYAHIAEELDLSAETVRGIISRKAVSRSADPSFTTYATSTLYRGKDEQGEVVLQWVKATRDNDKAAIDEMMSALAETLPKVKREPPRSKEFRKDTIAIYPMGDPHFGMFAWGEETGADFDIKIAERDLCAAVERLVDTVPACEQALIVNLGDFFHADNQESRTRSGHVLDTDTRWSKVLRVGIKAIRQCIVSALRKHEHVTVINAIGNHDEHSALFLSIALSNIYEDEPRVTIISNPTVKHYHRFEQNLFGVHHGHMIKMRDLPMQMAADRPGDWGETKFRFWFTGHIHHDSKIEQNGVVVESFRTLAAKDAWHTQMGYKSGRDMKAILFHAEYGEIERHTVSVEML